MAATTTRLPGYETTFITKAELTDEGLKTLQDRIKGIVSAYKGEMVIAEDLGRKKLAYPIHKETRGHYTYFVYTGTGDIVHEIERNLRLSEHVLRFLTVNLDKEFEPEAFVKRRGELQAASKKREEEREARREERMAERRAQYGEREHREYRPREDRSAAPASDEGSAE